MQGRVVRRQDLDAWKLADACDPVIAQITKARFFSRDANLILKAQGVGNRQHARKVGRARQDARANVIGGPVAIRQMRIDAAEAIAPDVEARCAKWRADEFMQAE